MRCFVRSNKLVAMCQRHCSSVNHTLSENATEFSQLIAAFFEKKLRPYFPAGKAQDEESLKDYVFDVYLAGSKPKYRVKLIDINPWRKHTNPLLFDWNSLEEIILAGESDHSEQEEDQGEIEMNKGKQ